MRHFDVIRPVSFFRDFDQFFSPDSGESKWKPLSRVAEEESHYHLALDIPGVDREHLKVDLNENVLIISGDRKNHFESGSAEYKSLASFEQKFSLPKDSNLEDIEVCLENGVLEVIIPKISQEEKNKSIQVNPGKPKFLNNTNK